MDESDSGDDAPARRVGASPVRIAAAVGLCLALVLGGLALNVMSFRRA